MSIFREVIAVIVNLDTVETTAKQVMNETVFSECVFSKNLEHSDGVQRRYCTLSKHIRDG